MGNFQKQLITSRKAQFEFIQTTPSTPAPDTPSRRATRASGLSLTTHYTQFKLNTQTYTVGDVVLLPCSRASGRGEPLLGLLLDCWLCEADQPKAKVLAFARAPDIRRVLKVFHRELEEEDVLENEVLLTQTEWTIEPTEILGLVNVIHHEEYKNKSAGSIYKRPNNPRSITALHTSFLKSTFFVRKLWNKTTGDWPELTALKYTGLVDSLRSGEKPDIGFLKEMFAEERKRKLASAKTKPSSSQLSTPSKKPAKKATRSTVSKSRQKSAGVKDKERDFIPRHGDSSSASDSNDSDDEECDSDASTVDMEDEDDILVERENITPSKRPRSASKISSPVLSSPARRSKKTQKLVASPLPLLAHSNTGESPLTPSQKARALLHVSAVPKILPCRADEHASIYSTIADAISRSQGTCLYVSGVPGTGKTATVRSVISTLKEQAATGDMDPFECVELNGMKMTEPTQAYSRFWEGLTGQRISPASAKECLQDRFAENGPNTLPCVVVMDELDILMSKINVVYNFFTWPDLPSSQLIVVAIANTMDLPERLSVNKVASRIGFSRINFLPYSHEQLVKIVTSRLEGLSNFIDKGAIEFCARKIASMTGDARKALDICRRAVEIWESENGKHPRVGISHVDASVKEMYASPVMRAIASSSLHQKLTLLAMLCVTRVSGLPETTLMDVLCKHSAFCHLKAIPALSMYEFAQIIGFLSSYGLILAEAKRAGDPIQKLRLNVPEDDVVAAIQGSGDEDMKRFLSSSATAANLRISSGR